MPQNNEELYLIAKDNFDSRETFDALLKEKGGVDELYEIVKDNFDSRDTFNKLLNDGGGLGKTQPDFTMGNLVGRTPSPKAQTQPRTQPQPKQKAQPQPQQQKPYSPSPSKSLESKLGFGSVVETIGKPNELTKKASSFSQYEQDQGYFRIV